MTMQKTNHELGRVGWRILVYTGHLRSHGRFLFRVLLLLNIVFHHAHDKMGLTEANYTALLEDSGAFYADKSATSLTKVFD